MDEMLIIEEGCLQDGMDGWDELPFVVLCSHWHSGQSSAFYSYLSSGYIDAEDLTNEIDLALGCFDEIESENERDEVYHAAFDSFRRFVTETGNRDAQHPWNPRW